MLCIPQSASGDLMIRNIQLKHSGKYVCMVKTEVDSVASAADLIVRGEETSQPSIAFPTLFCVNNSRNSWSWRFLSQSMVWMGWWMAVSSVVSFWLAATENYRCWVKPDFSQKNEELEVITVTSHLFSLPVLQVSAKRGSLRCLESLPLQTQVLGTPESLLWNEQFCQSPGEALS